MREDVDTTDTVDISSDHPLIRPNHFEIEQIRQFLLILLGICLAFAVVYLIMSTVGWAITTSSYGKDERLQIFEAIVSILFYGFGLLVAKNYKQKGLRLYGWLSIILVNITIIVIIAFHLIHVKMYFPSTERTAWLLFTYINYILSVWFHIFAVTIVIIIFSFRLARLLDADRQFLIRTA
ncbi:unnamed protein product [Adineta ricciae]|uniref:Uncharacterized protein n=1 Tax=Adineta ricciae TaxID=249248 RepID=A0A815NDX1_ADIRI|nr:unnamed protein product [Adineta ricciae]